MYWSKSKQFTIFLWVVAVLVLIPVVEANQDIRKNRYGHNCVVVETGEVSPYYTCRGCVIEEAMGCIQDMRANKSGTVATGCIANAIAQSPDGSNCCPKLTVESGGKLNLAVTGSAYPETLRCIDAVGCATSSLYTDLYNECLYTCPVEKDQVGNTICLAKFNAAWRTSESILLIASTTFFITWYFMLL